MTSNAVQLFSTTTVHSRKKCHKAHPCHFPFCLGGCADHLRPNPLITHWPSPSMTRGPPPRQLYVTRHHVLLRPGHARRLSNSRSPTTPVHGSDHSWGDTPPERARRIALPVEKAGTAPADRHSLGEEEEREREQWARRWRGRKG
jgi:hypothetical protein